MRSHNSSNIVSSTSAYATWLTQSWPTCSVSSIPMRFHILSAPCSESLLSSTSIKIICATMMFQESTLITRTVSKILSQESQQAYLQGRVRSHWDWLVWLLPVATSSSGSRTISCPCSRACLQAAGLAVGSAIRASSVCRCHYRLMKRSLSTTSNPVA